MWMLGLWLVSVSNSGAEPLVEEPAASTLVAVGEIAPDVALTSIDGDSFDLMTAVADGPVVLVFFRGVW